MFLEDVVLILWTIIESSASENESDDGEDHIAARKIPKRTRAL
jgi:hypothetical protein